MLLINLPYLRQVFQDGLFEALAQLELVQVLQLELEAPLLEEEGLNDVASLEANSQHECLTAVWGLSRND